MEGASCHLAGRPSAFQTRDGAGPGLSPHGGGQQRLDPGLPGLRLITATWWQQRGCSQTRQSRGAGGGGACWKGRYLPAAHPLAVKDPQRAASVPEAESKETHYWGCGMQAPFPGLGLLGRLAVFAAGIVRSLCPSPEVGPPLAGLWVPLLFPLSPWLRSQPPPPGFRGHQRARTSRASGPLQPTWPRLLPASPGVSQLP